ncbi:hypothetical protein BG844_14995 [Couchioplanes caeruleus subsp. caeruleus]|uniref:Uncharacterized protein n=2 Tax=Couchioplanes caeruleus TaxID=56438 RepID=A0A1K0FKV8_9ACTN|nr:hypothetical protein BG844_14995 [Couchioplanes caeruleus subsp. caeruleus]
MAAIVIAGLATALAGPPAAASAGPACQARGLLTADGETAYATTTEPGLAVCYPFEGRLGQDLVIGLYIPLEDGTWRGYASRATVLDPGGAVVAAFSAESPQVRPTFRVPVPTLSREGTYTLVLAPIQATSTLRVAASVSSRQVAGTTRVDGPGRQMSYDRVGQDKDLRLAGTSEQFVALRISDFAMATRQAGATPGLWIEVHRAQSDAVAYRGVAFGPGDFTVGPLREDGEFTVRTWPLDGSLGRATVGIVTSRP